MQRSREPLRVFLATSHVFQAMVGYTEEELRAVNFLDVTHEDYREANWALITELVERKRRQFRIDNNRRPALICQEADANRFRYSRGGMPKLLTKAKRICSSLLKPQSPAIVSIWAVVSSSRRRAVSKRIASTAFAGVRQRACT